MASTDAEIPIRVAGLFLGTLNDARVVTTGVVLGPTDSVSAAEAVLAALSDTVKTKLELTPKLLSAGLNFSPVSCCTDSVSPRVTGVSPFASTIIPTDGSAVTVSAEDG